MEREIFKVRGKFLLQFARNKLAMVGLVIIGMLALVAVFAPYLAPEGYNAMDLARVQQGPTGDCPLGTDEFGRSVLSRIIWGCRISLGAGVVVLLIGGTLGSLLGLTAGYFGQTVDQVISRIVDILLTFPYILIAIAIVSILGQGLQQTMIAVGLSYVPRFARLIRGYVISIRELEYVEAIRALGGSHLRIIFRHILPNCLSAVLVYGTLAMGMAILAESALSFLGLGIQPPMPSWGVMIATGKEYIRTSPHMSLFPGLCITITVMGFNFFGDGLRDFLDPKFRRD